ncbi:MAG: DUF433 domain-containing protein [Chloroflexota bacterium]
MLQEAKVVMRSPTVQGGAAVLAGTRMPVGSIVVIFQLYNGNLAEVQAAYPHLTVVQIQAALAYYEQHRTEIDDDEARNSEAFEALAHA